MSTEKLFIIDPFNESHLKMVKEFEKANDLDNGLSKEILLIIDSETQDEYYKQIKNSNSVDTYLFLEDASMIKDICHIQGYRDTKTCNIVFPKLNKKYKNRKLINISKKYAFDTLKMEEVFVITSNNDIQMINNLENDKFECLGEDDGYITFLSERENDIISNQRIMQ